MLANWRSEGSSVEVFQPSRYIVLTQKWGLSHRSELAEGNGCPKSKLQSNVVVTLFLKEFSCRCTPLFEPESVFKVVFEYSKLAHLESQSENLARPIPPPKLLEAPLQRKNATMIE